MKEACALCFRLRCQLVRSQYPSWVFRSNVTGRFGDRDRRAGAARCPTRNGPVLRRELNRGPYPWRFARWRETVPKKRMALRMIKGVIRLKWEAQLPHEKIAAALKASNGVVAKYVALASAAGLD